MQNHNEKCSVCNREGYEQCKKASAYFKRYVCWVCGQTEGARGADFSERTNAFGRRISDRPKYDFMIEQQYEVIYLQTLLYALRREIRMITGSKTI